MRAALWLAFVTLGLSLQSNAQAAAPLKLVEVITSPERTETLKAIVKNFEDANPGVRVEITSLPWGQSFESKCPTYGWRSTPITARSKASNPI
jgi:multiple sugar transport system substrate-binding protein